MEKEFVPYEQALALKELRFDEDCFKYYNEEGTLSTVGLYYGYDNPIDFKCLAPIYQQAFRWFRKKYPELDFAVGKIYDGTNNYHYNINLLWEYCESTYQEAELECLKKLIEITKNK